MQQIERPFSHIKILYLLIIIEKVLLKNKINYAHLRFAEET